MASSVTHVSAYSATSSALYQSTVEGSHIYRETFEDRIRQWRHWLLGTDIEGRTVIMGRSLIDWRKFVWKLSGCCGWIWWQFRVVIFGCFMCIVLTQVNFLLHFTFSERRFQTLFQMQFSLVPHVILNVDSRLCCFDFRCTSAFTTGQELLASNFLSCSLKKKKNVGLKARERKCLTE